MKKEKAYISGPVTAIGIEAARQNFLAAEKYLRRQGYRTINPLRMRLPVFLATHFGYTGYRLCLLLELVWLAFRANVIYMLPDWQQSGGARTERSLAMALNIPIIYHLSKADFKKHMKQSKAPAPSGSAAGSSATVPVASSTGK